MKGRADLVQGIVRKAESDLENARLCLDAGRSLDTACFHAQQAAERFVKAYLAANAVDFPFIHNLEKLIGLCAERDPSFEAIAGDGAALTPYAVELRYDEEFWPDLATARTAYETALRVRALVLERLPKDVSEHGDPEVV